MSKTLYPHVCDYCGKEHFISTSQYNRILKGKQKKSFCSKECTSLYQTLTNCIQSECDYCGKKIIQPKSQMKKTKNHFCSHECADKFRSESKRKNVICEMCGKTFNIQQSQNQRFCSCECQNKWQSLQVGKLNPRYKRELIKCNWCGNEFEEKQYKINNFDNHFCSTKCRREWYSQVFSQDEQWKEESRKRILREFRDGSISKINSKPQLIIDEILNDLDISFEREKVNNYYSYDNYLCESGLIIEVQGDYWHCNPLKYNEKILHRQANRIKCDKAKHTYTKNTYDIEILYLWESDIVNNPELCKKLIVEYISKNGILKNYHSFNYILDNNVIVLKENLIIPYQEQQYKNYKNKIIEEVS